MPQEREVNCPICFEQFEEAHAPRTLRCGHTVCTPCLETILTRAAGDRLCPECRRPLKVGYCFMIGRARSCFKVGKSGSCFKVGKSGVVREDKSRCCVKVRKSECCFKVGKSWCCFYVGNLRWCVKDWEDVVKCTLECWVILCKIYLHQTVRGSHHIYCCMVYSGVWCTLVLKGNYQKNLDLKQ